MTQFQPPTPYEPQPPGGYDSLSREAGDPQRWSASAITGFVCSLLGCTGIGAILGIIFGVVGIVVTHSGRRRGLGLAIAAIPVSLLTGLVSALVFIGMAGFFGLGVFMARLPEVLSGDTAAMPAAVSSIRGLASDEFNDTVTDDDLEAWLEAVASKHGRLVELLEPKPVQTGSTGVNPAFDLSAKFVNGRANVRIVLNMQEPWRPKVQDIEVDGLSPRRPK